MKQFFKWLLCSKRDIKNYNGVEYVAYSKEYTDENLDDDRYDSKCIKYLKIWKPRPKHVINIKNMCWISYTYISSW